jgi:hypothetical protein
MAFNYLTWQDSGAPTLNGVNGSLTNSGGTGVLDWALVTKAGWTKSQTATNGSVFTPVTGNCVLMVIHDSATSGSAKGATVRAGESASGVSSASLTNPFPTVALIADGSSCWTASTTADSTQRPYYILVTDSFLFIWMGHGYTTANYNTVNTSSNAHVFGQFSKALSSDSYNTILSVSNQVPSSSACCFANAVGTVPLINTRLWADRSPDGAVFSPCQTILTPAGTQVGNPSGVPAYPNGIDNKLHLSKLALADTYAQSAAVGAKSLQVRGFLPNLWCPLETVGTLINSKTFVDSSYNGAALFQYLVDTTQSHRVILETTNTWSAPTI